MPALQGSVPPMSEKLPTGSRKAGRLDGVGPHLQRMRIRACGRILSPHDISRDLEELFAPDRKPLPKPATEKHNLTAS